MFFGSGQKEQKQLNDLPTGINSITLQKSKTRSGKPKRDDGRRTGRKMGASRTTARRYAEFLVSQEEALAELEYGIIGRPERKYYLAHE